MIKTTKPSHTLTNILFDVFETMHSHPYSSSLYYKVKPLKNQLEDILTNTLINSRIGTKNNLTYSIKLKRIQI